MKRYICFFGSHYYPFGGMEDFLGSSEKLQDAINLINARLREEFNDSEPIEDQFKDAPKMNWGHIYDSKEHKIVWTLDEEELSFFKDFPPENQ